MFNFKYEILVNSETGKPYVHISKDQVDHPEHKFMAVEITRYLLLQLLKDDSTELSQDILIAIMQCSTTLEYISDNMGDLILEQNNSLEDTLGELGINIDNNE